MVRIALRHQFASFRRQAFACRTLALPLAPLADESRQFTPFHTAVLCFVQKRFHGNCRFARVRLDEAMNDLVPLPPPFVNTLQYAFAIFVADCRGTFDRFLNEFMEGVVPASFHSRRKIVLPHQVGLKPVGNDRLDDCGRLDKEFIFGRGFDARPGFAVTVGFPNIAVLGNARR